jgi:hypothetical protein
MALTNLSKTALHTLLVALGLALVLLATALTTPSLAAAPLKVKVAKSSSKGAVAIKVGGARNARSLALYVDGKLRSRDAARPWRFGKAGRVALGPGRHRVAVSAKFRRGKTRTTARRWVVIVKPRNGRGKQPAPAPSPAPVPPTTDPEPVEPEPTPKPAPIDNIAPTVSWKSPTGGTLRSVPANKDCVVTAKDDRKLARVDFYADGKKFWDEAEAPYNCTLTSQILTPGTHVLKAVAIDVSGNRAEHSIAVEVPKTASDNTPEPAPAQPGSAGGILWRGDFDTGNLSQWDVAQRVASDRIQLTTSPRRQGSHAARFEVRSGDNIGNTAPRAEVAAELGEREGDERYYRWYTYWDPSFPTSYRDSFVTFTQWRATDESDSMTSFMQWGDRIELRRDGTRWSAPLVKGVWHEFIYHVKWSPDAKVGFIELWYDGQLVLPKTHVRTMAGSPGRAVGNYVKQGLYKSDEIPTGVLYHDGFVAGTSLAAVTAD